jgi:signal transduction histidine kinase
VWWLGGIHASSRLSINGKGFLSRNPDRYSVRGCASSASGGWLIPLAPCSRRAAARPERGGSSSGTGLSVDIDESKKALERLDQMPADLAHMNRLSIMGELAASLAHEIAQPIAAAHNNARAALNFSDRRSTDLGEVRESLTCVVDDPIEPDRSSTVSGITSRRLLHERNLLILIKRSLM